MSLEDEFPESRAEINRGLVQGPRPPPPPFGMWVLLVLALFGVAYYSSSEVGRHLNPDHDVTVSPVEVLVRRERAFRGLHRNLEGAVLAATAFRWRMGALPPTQWTDDIRSEYDMHLEIVTGLRKACDAAATEYNAQAKLLGPGAVAALGFPAVADCEQVEVDTYTP